MFDAIDRRACEGLHQDMREEGLLDAPTEAPTPTPRPRSGA